VKHRQRSEFWTKVGLMQPFLTLVIAAISALAGAGVGILGFYKFYFYEKAAYEQRAEVKSTLEVRPSNVANRCEAVFTVEMENNGISAFEVNETKVRVWAFDSKVLKDTDKATYIGLDQMQSGPATPLFDSSIDSLKSGFETKEIPFVRHYAVGDKFFRTFKWLIRRDAGPNLYFRTDFNPNEKVSWFTAAWSPTCSEASPAPPEGKSVSQASPK
jgi:hypothetical protein